MIYKHARIIQHHFATVLQGALLDSYEERHSKQTRITMKLRALEQTVPPELFERDGVIHERVKGNYVPIQLHFSGISELKSNDFFTDIASLPQNDLTRTINDMLSWRQPERQDIFYLIVMQAPKVDSLMFYARHAMHERLSRESTPFTLERDWSPPPPMPERLVPQPKRLHQRFGGDPITFHLESQPYRHRLFIGGIEIQPDERPQVDVVFNLGEESIDIKKKN